MNMTGSKIFNANSLLRNGNEFN